MKKAPAGFFPRLVHALGSLRLSVVLLLLLGLLTWLGTLEQVHSSLFDVQKKYFESFFLVHDAGGIPIPLPGANLVLCVLFLNLVVGGILRLRRTWALAGVYITHLGILLLLVAAAAKLYFSDEGHITLFESQQSGQFESYYRWELALSQRTPDGRVHELLIPQEDLQDATDGRAVRFTSAALPFDLEVTHFMRNSRPLPKGPMFEVQVPVIDGAFLRAEAPFKAAEQNTAGCYVTAIDKRTGDRLEGLLWGRQLAPWTVTAGGDEWSIDLRKERYPLPFTIRLDKFTKEDHPRTNMPRVFSSAVTVLEGSASRPVEISMNKPLRDRGYVLYQASWGPADARPGEPLFSTLSVVRNPVDRYPLYACIVIAVGLLLHFLRKLARYVRIELRPS